jgi:subtilase family serine protease
MKNITTVTTVLTLLILWSGMALAAEPLPKKPATPPSQKQSPGAPQQPGSKTLTTPGVSVTAAFADLAVTEIKVQEFGQGALIQVTVKNLGTASADANLYQLRVVLDGYRLPVGDQPLFNARSPIEPNQTRVTGFIPTQSGRTEVKVSLIPSGAAASDNPANNTLTRTLDLPEVRPDFTVEDLSLTPENLIQVKIRNGGGYAPRDAQGTVEVYVNNQLTSSTIVRMWPNPRETKVITTIDPIVGTRNVRATVNPSHTVLEMNYENNTLSKEFTAHVLKPDLIVRWLGFWQESDIFGTTNKLVIIIANIGKATSPRTIKTEVFYGDRLIATPTLEGPIGVGSQRFNTGVPVVPYDTYRVTVDPQNEIDEEREDNNSLTARVELLR